MFISLDLFFEPWCVSVYRISFSFRLPWRPPIRSISHSLFLSAFYSAIFRSRLYQFRWACIMSTVFTVIFYFYLLIVDVVIVVTLTFHFGKRRRIKFNRHTHIQPACTQNEHITRWHTITKVYFLNNAYLLPHSLWPYQTHSILLNKMFGNRNLCAIRI